jgi:hypothetical protein
MKTTNSYLEVSIDERQIDYYLYEASQMYRIKVMDVSEQEI